MSDNEYLLHADVVNRLDQARADAWSVEQSRRRRIHSAAGARGFGGRPAPPMYIKTARR